MLLYTFWGSLVNFFENFCWDFADIAILYLEYFHNVEADIIRPNENQILP